ncbi:MAG: quinoprotein dehydrogenase-associated putative ABC transporter substrate-binding protein [Pseudomonadota bacterium]
MSPAVKSAARKSGSFLRWLIVAASAAVILPNWPATADAPPLKVCADPDNMPFSNRAEEGFENRLAELLAEKIGTKVAYTWRPLGIGFVRQTLLRGRCDVIIGHVRDHVQVRETAPYYASGYVLVTRSSGPLAGVTNLEDARLEDATLGVIVGSPPAARLAQTGLIGQAKPYRLLVDRRHDGPSEQMIDDVLQGRTDGALMWGPAGGVLARQSDGQLVATVLTESRDAPDMADEISLSVRGNDRVMFSILNRVIEVHSSEIKTLLSDAGVPVLTIGADTH